VFKAMKNKNFELSAEIGQLTRNITVQEFATQYDYVPAERAWTAADIVYEIPTIEGGTGIGNEEERGERPPQRNQRAPWRRRNSATPTA